MEIYTNQLQRPSLLPAVCAPLTAVSAAAWRPAQPSHLVAVVEQAQVSQAHRVRVQAELTRIPVAAGGSYGTSGLLASTAFGSSSKGVDSATKRMTDGANGAPPRGRPV